MLNFQNPSLYAKEKMETYLSVSISFIDFGGVFVMLTAGMSSIIGSWPWRVGCLETGCNWLVAQGSASQAQLVNTTKLQTILIFSIGPIA